MDSSDVSTREGAARVRLLAANLPAGKLHHYGTDSDQVWEEFGPESGPAVVFVHGGFFRPTVDRGHARTLAHDLAARGQRVVLLEYRRIEGSPMVSVDDVCTAHAAVMAHLPGRPLWVGHSAGGTLVTLLALSTPGVHALALAPLLDIRRAAAENLGVGATRAWLGLAGEPLGPLPMGVDPRSGLLGAGVGEGSSVKVVHGSFDGAVPLEHTSGVLAAMVEHGREPLPLQVVEGAHHFDLIDPASPWWPSVLGALDD